jgi:hypothetical protein
MAVEGDLGSTAVDALLPTLDAATTTPDRCHFGLWVGWGDLHPGVSSTASFVEIGQSPLDRRRRRTELRRLRRPEQDAGSPVTSFVAACAVQAWWGGRDMLLFDGPVAAVSTMGTPDPFSTGLRRRGPQWWWPEDRSWFVATEIDFPWSYVGGSRDLVDAITARPDLEAVRVDHGDRW